jgi:hypothetical protein
MFDRTAATDVLKESYIPDLVKSLNNQTVLYQKVKKSGENFNEQGKYFVWALHTGRNVSAGLGKTESETLQEPGQQSYDRATEYAKYLYGRIEFSGPIVEHTKNNATSFVRAVDSEMRGLREDFMKTFNRQLHSDGTDALAYYVSGGSGTTMVADDSRGNIRTYLPTDVRYPVQYIDAGGTITAGSDGNATPTYLSSGTVFYAAVGADVTTGVNVQLFDAATGGSAQTISASSADGDYLIPSGTFGKQVWGLEAIVGTGNPALRNLHGVAVADGPHWVSQSVGDETSASTFKDISYGDMQTLVSLIQSKSPATMNDIDLLITSWPVYNRYVQLLKDENILVNETKLDGGHSAVLFSTKPLVADPQAHDSRIYFLCTKYLMFLQLKDIGFIEKDGSIFHRNENKDSYRATMATYTNFATKLRSVHGLYKGIL